MERSRVLFIHNTLWSHYKGFVFSELYAVLESRQIEMRVIQQAVTERMRAGLGDVDLGCHRYPYVLLETGSLDDVPAARRMGRLVKEILRSRADVVVIPGYADCSYWAALAVCMLTGRKRIIAFDSTSADRPHGLLREWAKRAFVGCFEMAFCYGNRSRQYLEALGMPISNIKVRCQATANEIIESIYRAEAEGRTTRCSELRLSARNFISVGRLSREKNLTTLVRAFARLKEAEPAARDWGLILVGSGPERERLGAAIGQLKVRDVVLTGGVSWRDVPRWFAVSDVMVLPSLSEPWGLVVNEAMACGLPVVVSSRCGAADDLVVNGDNGFVFDPLDEAGLAEVLAECVNDDAAIRRMGERSKEMIKEYTPRNAALQMANGIVEVLACR